MTYTTASGVVIPSGTDAFSPTAQFKTWADKAATYESRVVVAIDSDRTALAAPVLRDGLLCYVTGTDLTWLYEGSTWNLHGAGQIVGRVMRSASTITINSADFTNLSADAGWSTTTPAGQTVGITAYSNGWTIPATGIYEVSYSLTAGAAFLACVTVNKSSGVAPADFKIPSVGATIQSIASVTSSGQMRLASGDVLRLYGLAPTGTTITQASLGFFAVSFIRASA